MKKLISILIIFTTTSIVCMTTAMVSFAVNDVEMTHHNIVHDDVDKPSSDCCEAMQWDCDEEAHGCCISPFSDSNTTSNIHNTNEKKDFTKWKNIDFSFLALLQENLEENYIEKLHSPPISWESSRVTNFYITLTGSTKSNC